MQRGGAGGRRWNDGEMLAGETKEAGGGVGVFGDAGWRNQATKSVAEMLDLRLSAPVGASTSHTASTASRSRLDRL